MAGAIAAFHAIGKGYAIGGDPHGMSYLHGSFFFDSYFRYGGSRTNL